MLRKQPSSTLITAITLLSSSIGSIVAHKGCGGHDVAKRNLGMDSSAPSYIERRQYDPTSTDPVAECSYYSYQPVIDNKAKFPAIWQTADIVAGDTDAQALFATVQTAISTLAPNVSIKGGPSSLSGDFSSFTPTYSYTDPDCWWTYKNCDTPKNSQIPADITTLPEPLSYGIGFDDGPNCSHNAFYDFLRDNEQKATMFFIGSNVMDWPLQAQQAVTDGHQICVHTWSHQYTTAMTDSEAFSELYYTMQAIKLVTGLTPKCWRPPFGDIDNRIRVIADTLNLTSILWEEDSEDWRINTGNPPVTQADIDANYQAVIDKAGNGTYSQRGLIMLTHELNNFTMSEAIKWYPQLKQAFKYLVPIATAYNETQPYVETNVTYPDFASYTGNSAGASSSSSSSSSSSISGSMASTGSMTVTATRSAQTGASSPAATTKTGAAQKTGIVAPTAIALAMVCIVASAFR